MKLKNSRLLGVFFCANASVTAPLLMNSFEVFSAMTSRSLTRRQSFRRILLSGHLDTRALASIFSTLTSPMVSALTPLIKGLPPLTEVTMTPQRRIEPYLIACLIISIVFVLLVLISSSGSQWRTTGKPLNFSERASLSPATLLSGSNPTTLVYCLIHPEALDEYMKQRSSAIEEIEKLCEQSRTLMLRPQSAIVICLKNQSRCSVISSE